VGPAALLPHGGRLLSCHHAAHVARGDMTEPVIVAPPKP
jgi:hypothetical protein